MVRFNQLNDIDGKTCKESENMRGRNNVTEKFAMCERLLVISNRRGNRTDIHQVPEKCTVIHLHINHRNLYECMHSKHSQSLYYVKHDETNRSETPFMHVQIEKERERVERQIDKKDFLNKITIKLRYHHSGTTML